MTRPVRQWILLACTILSFRVATFAGDGGPEEGSPHWAFVTPTRPRLPTVRTADWVRSPIDRFVLARLEEEGLTPSPEAGRRNLIRRVTLGVTGLPPTSEEIEDFLADASPGAYERVVDRLLSSPAYGERMTLPWLDAARYADTHGYLFDTQRSMWRWRDWVIEAYNDNLPFDRFTVEQLAGDLLDEPTLSQRIATGFNRNHMINNEAGAIAMEYLVENVVDRVDTTSTVWMGLTTGCARCHEHKNDPISQKEFYELYAFFDNIPERGLDGFNTNATPSIEAPPPEQIEQLADLERRITSVRSGLDELRSEIDRAQASWEGSITAGQEPVRNGLKAYWPLDHTLEDDLGAAPAEFGGGTAAYEDGVLGGAVSLDGLRYLDAGDRGRFDRDDAFSLAAWIFPTERKGRRSIFSRMKGADEGFRGYALQLVAGMPALYLIHRFSDDLVNVQGKSALQLHRWHHVLATYDGKGKAAGVKLYVNGKAQEVSILGDTLSDSFDTREPLHVGKGHPGAMFKGRIDEVRIYDRSLGDAQIARLPGISIQSLLAVERTKRNPEQSRRIREYYLEHHAPDEWRSPYRNLAELTERQRQLRRTVPTVMVMTEREKRGETRILLRGLYDRPGEKVHPGTPRILGPMDPELPRNRLGLARWLTDPAHPLTARVAVNRHWQTHFGTGLVATPGDFGIAGEPPSHPKLLDWLATEFVRTGWDVKAMQKLIVTSATYRQSSRASPKLLHRDRYNRLLARGPRLRMTAEALRDQALAVSGLLVRTIGGPSVKPYQPAGLWKEVAFDTSGANLTAQVYEQGRGEDLYRRSLYTFWKRTSPPPSMLLFDAPDRERCVVRRGRTNTPLQALAVMNETTYVEASRKLAERMMLAAAGRPENGIAHGFLLATARRTSPAEEALLLKLFREQSDRFRKNLTAAAALLDVGDSVRDESLDVPELAAYTTVANVILNLDETLVRN